MTVGSWAYCRHEPQGTGPLALSTCGLHQPTSVLPSSPLVSAPAALCWNEAQFSQWGCKEARQARNPVLSHTDPLLFHYRSLLKLAELAITHQPEGHGREPLGYHLKGVIINCPGPVSVGAASSPAGSDGNSMDSVDSCCGLRKPAVSRMPRQAPIPEG